MKRILKFLKLKGCAPEIKDVSAELYPESERPHRAVPTAEYKPLLTGAQVEPFYRAKGVKRF